MGAQHRLAGESGSLRDRLRAQVARGGEQLDPLEAELADPPPADEAGRPGRVPLAARPGAEPVAHLPAALGPGDAHQGDRAEQDAATRLRDRQREAPGGPQRLLAGCDVRARVIQAVGAGHARPAGDLRVLAELGERFGVVLAPRAQRGRAVDELPAEAGDPRPRPAAGGHARARSRSSRASVAASSSGSQSPSAASARRRPPRARSPRSPSSAWTSASAARRRLSRLRTARSIDPAWASRADASSSIPLGGAALETASTGVSRLPSERRAACRSARVRSAGRPRSALVTTRTSGISMIPDLRNW